jgi:beta-lactamase superfamily II metal-dependent hydrolase
VFTLIFPYPFVPRPRVIEVAVYYALLAVWIARKPLGERFRRIATRRDWTHPRAPMALWTGFILLLLAPLVFAPPRDTRPPGLHVTVLSVGYGSSVLVESPGGQRILIDAGFVERDRARRNEAERTILPFLATSGRLDLDGLILTSPLPERSGGAATLLDHLRVGKVVLPPALAGLSPGWTQGELAERLGQHERFHGLYAAVVSDPHWPTRRALAEALADRRADPANRWAGWHAPVAVARPGAALFAEQHGDRRFAIEVLGPESVSGSDHPVEDAGLALRVVYGDFALLLPGTRHLAGQAALVAANKPETLRAQILVAPHHGAARPGRSDRPARDEVEAALAGSAGPLLDAVQPEAVIVEFGNPRPVLGDASRPVPGVYDITRAWYADRLGSDALLSTDRNLAVMVHSDGTGFTLDTQARRNRAEGGDDDAVSDLAVGL